MLLPPIIQNWVANSESTITELVNENYELIYIYIYTKIYIPTKFYLKVHKIKILKPFIALTFQRLERDRGRRRRASFESDLFSRVCSKINRRIQFEGTIRGGRLPSRHSSPNRLCPLVTRHVPFFPRVDRRERKRATWTERWRPSTKERIPILLQILKWKAFSRTQVVVVAPGRVMDARPFKMDVKNA